MAIAETELALEVATPLGKELSLRAKSVQVPSVAGEFGVLPGHVPLLAALKPGLLKYEENGKAVAAAVGGGFVEADAGRVRLITEFFARPEDVDVAQAQQDLEAAEQRLKEYKGMLGDAGHAEAQRNLEWALARLELAGGSPS